MMSNHIFVEEVIGNITNASSKESFTFSCLSDDCVAYDGNDRTENLDPNHDQHEHELFFDMDITLPFTWGDTLTPHNNNYHYINSPGNISNCLQDTQEFEFSITFSDDGSSSNGFIGSLSPADDLFYKGQLLPLHLPPRQRMLERLSSLESNTTELIEEEEEENFNANGSNGCTSALSELIDKEKYPFSCQGSLVEDVYTSKKPSSTMVRSNGTWMDMTKVQDASVFPDCYKDPALQMLQEDVNYVATKGYARPSIGWRVVLPGSRRLSSQMPELLQDGFPDCDVRKAKEAHKWGFSRLTLRASASFFKSLFHGGELGRVLVHQKGTHKHHGGARAAIQEGEEEVEEDKLSSYANCSENNITYGYDNQPFKLENAQAERDKVIKKAKEYLQKYVRLFKSMYVSISHTSHEQSRNLLASSSMEGMSITCRSSSCKAKQGRVHMKPKPLRTSSFSKRPRGNGDSIVNCIQYSGMLSARLCDEGAGCSSVVRASSCPEVDNPIQGAIAHCKQSSSLAC